VRARPAHRPRGSGQAVRGRAAGPIEPSAAVAGASARPRALPESLGLSTTAQFDKVAGGYRPEPANVRRRFLPTQNGVI